mgnify:CR=1 FL=1
MIFNIPVLCRGFWFDGAKTAYFASSSALTAAYLFGWIVFWKENSLRKAAVLSVVPSLLFLESGFFFAEHSADWLRCDFCALPRSDQLQECKDELNMVALKTFYTADRLRAWKPEVEKRN